MRKGLVSYIIILCMLIPLAVGCQNNTAGSTTPTLADSLLQATESAKNAAQPEATEPNTTGSEVTEPQEAESSTPSASLDPTQPPATPPATEPVNQETEPPTTTPPQTEPPKETTPPVTEEPEITEPTTPTPKPTEPKPTQPPVTEPPQTEPPATKPAEVIDLDALVQYGLNYAANTHGYRIYPGTRAGYYPAYTCTIRTMEEGKAALRGCVDDTTRALLAVPGTQIAVEIDGVMCRTRIDIVITRQSENIYLVNVFYG